MNTRQTTTPEAGSSDKQVAATLFRIKDKISAKLIEEIIGILELYRSIDLHDENLLLLMVYKIVPSVCKTPCTGNVFADRLEFIDRNSFRLYMSDTNRNIDWSLPPKRDARVKRAKGVRRTMAVHKDDHLRPPYFDIPSLFQLLCTVRRYDRFRRNERPKIGILNHAELADEASEQVRMIAAEIDRAVSDEQMRPLFAEKLIKIVLVPNMSHRGSE